MIRVDDVYASMVEPYALSALDSSERADFEAHLAGGCEECRKAVLAQLAVVEALSRDIEAPSSNPVQRTQLLDLAEAPRNLPDLRSLSWDEVMPGIRVHVMKDDPARGVRACLVWAVPGARHPRHRHKGDEVILVLQGSLADERARYGPGEICRSQPGSVHSEVALPGDDCVCYVVYYGELEMLEEPPA
jgi:putative transcriptional regulator